MSPMGYTSLAAAAVVGSVGVFAGPERAIGLIRSAGSALVQTIEDVVPASWHFDQQERSLDDAARQRHQTRLEADNLKQMLAAQHEQRKQLALEAGELNRALADIDAVANDMRSAGKNATLIGGTPVAITDLEADRAEIIDRLDRIKTKTAQTDAIIVKMEGQIGALQSAIAKLNEAEQLGRENLVTARTEYRIGEASLLAAESEARSRGLAGKNDSLGRIMQRQKIEVAVLEEKLGRGPAAEQAALKTSVDLAALREAASTIAQPTVSQVVQP